MRLLKTMGLLALTASLPAQVLVLDRGYSDPFIPTSGGQRIGGIKDNQSFIGDDFTIGAKGEVWIIDVIRTWLVLDADPDHPQFPGDLFEKIFLYGALANDSPPNQPGQAAECACHGLVVLKSTNLLSGAASEQSVDISISPVSYDKVQDVRATDNFKLWRVEFRNLRWSVPGGAAIQFAVRGMGRTRPGKGEGPVWFNHASLVSKPHRLRVFDESGRLKSFLDGGNEIGDQPVGINVQVWAHLPANVSISRAGDTIQVIVRGGPSIDVKQVDLETLRLGPKDSAPATARLQDRGDGSASLTLDFRAADAGLGTGNVSVCLSGKRLDGLPFEGCDLVPTLGSGTASPR